MGSRNAPALVITIGKTVIAGWQSADLKAMASARRAEPATITFHFIMPARQHPADGQREGSASAAAELWQKMAETEGFEPSIRFKAYDDLANRCLQPLGHVSANQCKPPL